jgi:hypothetical protein
VKSKDTDKLSTVSVALATYNGEQYLAEQLYSIANQTRLPDELVISDDGSTDGTLAICRSFAERVPFKVHIFEADERLGFTQNFARALAQCSGDVIFLCDQDDVWYQNKVERMLRAFRENPHALLAIHDLAYCDVDLRRMGQTKLQRFRVLGNPIKHYMTGMASAVRRPLLDLCLPVPEHPGVTHDTWIHLLARLLGVKVVVREVLADYRRHGSSATGVEGVNAAGHRRAGAMVNGQIRNRSVEKLVNLSEQWQIAGERIGERFDALAVGSVASARRLKRAIATAERAERAARERSVIVRRPLLGRFLGVGRLLVTGRYWHFNGVRSALKDAWLKWT